MKKHFICIVISFVAVLACRCSKQPTIAGDVTETGNAYVVGKILKTDGTPAPNARVQLLPLDYDPLRVSREDITYVPTDTTNVQGEFSMTFRDSGLFNLAAVHLTDRTRLLTRNVVARIEETSNVTDTLRTPGSIVVRLPDEANAFTGHVYVPGSYAGVAVDVQAIQRGYVVLDSVPVGVHDVYYNQLDPVPSAVKLLDSVTVNQGQTVGMPGWKYSKRIILNTSGTGADINESVYHFPVLVRLRDSTFAFGQAKGDGRDIRFSYGLAGGRLLPYEIERWDSANALAELWILVDTIFAQNDSQSITMYWGNDTASDASNPAVVFDTANGFVGVWHLNEEEAGRGNTDIYKDATWNQNHGDDYLIWPNGVGFVGRGKDLDGEEDYIDLGHISQVSLISSMTISAWFSAYRFNDSLSNVIVSQYDTTDPHVCRFSLEVLREIPNDSIGFVLAFRVQTTAGEEVLLSTLGMLHPNQTTHAVAVLDSHEVRFYRNGEPAGSAMLAGAFAGGSDAITNIGRNPNNTGHFAGIMDEIRLEAKARSAQWEKLCFENQKEEHCFIRITN